MGDSQRLIPAAGYARVSSDRQDVDLSVSAQRRAIRDWAEKNGYALVREYVDEAESGLVDSRAGFSRMIHDGCRPNPPFEVVLVNKFSRFSRIREHAIVYKAKLRARGVRVISISEPSDDTPTGRLLEGVIETLDQFYSENLAQDVLRGMRESALRGGFLASRAPFGYRRVKVPDGERRERTTLEVDLEESAIVVYMFERSLEGRGLKAICRDLNDRGITIKGGKWYKTTVHSILTNEAYVGTLVWGRTRKGAPAPDPVRVEDAWPAIVSKETFDQVQDALAERAPKKDGEYQGHPDFLLSGLLVCGVCDSPFMAQGAKSSQYFYYLCSKLHREGAGACESIYLPAPEADERFLAQFTELYANSETCAYIAHSTYEGMDTQVQGLTEKLVRVKDMLADVEARLETNYLLVEDRKMPLDLLAPRLTALRERQERLIALREEVLRLIADAEDTPAGRAGLEDPAVAGA